MSDNGGMCGFEPDLSQLSHPPGDYCCCRPVPDGFSRCVWHENKENKDASKLQKYRADGPEVLDEIILRGATIGKGLEFEGCRIYASDLTGASLKGTNLRDSDLRYSNLSNANLRNADVSESNLQEVNLSDTSLGGTDFEGSHMSATDLTGSTALKTDFSNTHFAGAVLDKVEYRVTDFTNSHMTGVSFEDAEFHKPIFSEAKLQSTNLSDVRLGASNFTNASLKDANLSGCFLKSTTMNGTTLTGANLSDANCEEGNFKNAELQNSRLEETNLSEANLNGANLEGAFLLRTDLRGAELTNTKIFESVFENIITDSKTKFGEYVPYEEEGEYNKAVRVYRRLSDLKKENGDVKNSQRYYIRHKESRRKLAKKKFAETSFLKSVSQDWGIHWTKLLLSSIQKIGSRWVMKHGESPWRVIGTSLTIIVLCSFIYPFIGGIRPAISSADPHYLPIDIPFVDIPEGLQNASVYAYFSLVTFTTLGYGDLQPAGFVSRTLAGLEAFVGGLLMALLVFVLGRRTTW
ncbi:pentapeptide repeat-containing protein [Halorussus salinus]|uniref:pentapeptide repeat-containing protein n=1 Tax=Halorussus salinus TaxID=1364935 RepID=UPI001091BB50|nr:pentapeptide repeat-containing protein [Halorussus salinus]